MACVASAAVPCSLACLVDLRLPLGSRCPQAAAGWCLTSNVDAPHGLRLCAAPLCSCSWVGVARLGLEMQLAPAACARSPCCLPCMLCDFLLCLLPTARLSGSLYPPLCVCLAPCNPRLGAGSPWPFADALSSIPLHADVRTSSAGATNPSSSCWGLGGQLTGPRCSCVGLFLRAFSKRLLPPHMRRTSVHV